MKTTVSTVNGVLGKVCPRCAPPQWKPQQEFYRAENKPGNMANYCIPCTATRSRDNYTRNRSAILASCHRYRQAHAEQRAAYFRQYYQNNRAACDLLTRQWRKDNPARSREIVHGWETRNPDKLRQHRRKTNASRRGAEGTFTNQDLQRLVALQRGLCYYCGKPLTAENSHLDHKQPLARGGTNWPDNLCYACAYCNLHKHAKTEAEFIALLASGNLNPR